MNKQKMEEKKEKSDEERKKGSLERTNERPRGGVKPQRTSDSIIREIDRQTYC